MLFVLPSDPEPERKPLSFAELIDATYNGLAPRFRERTSKESITAIADSLDITDRRSARPTPCLAVKRLRFIGEKQLLGRQPQPVRYEQSFLGGVNVLLVPDNDVGKSSVMKTIKFALTGDNSSYDSDVREWIKEIWLTIAIDGVLYTNIIQQGAAGVRAALVAGEADCPLADAERQALIFQAESVPELQMQLQSFFFTRFGLNSLGWTQQASPDSSVGERKTSWLTYFQALQILGGGDKHLICDAAHSTGNQDGLIVSSLLGLALTQPLNRLGIDAKLLKRDIEQRQKKSRENINQALEEVSGLEEQLASARRALDDLAQNISERRRSVEQGHSARRIIELQNCILRLNTERTNLSTERDDLSVRITRTRARVRHLREAIALRLHFTGIEVSLCPHCDTTVDDSAVERERSSHACRLCGKQAKAASSDELSSIEQEAKLLEAEVKLLENTRSSVGERLTEVRTEQQKLSDESTNLAKIVSAGISYALPTAEEEGEWKRLYGMVGRLEAALVSARTRSTPDAEEKADEMRVRILEKLREVLKEEAGRRNHDILKHLGQYTEEIAKLIGTDSISGVTCSSLGKLALQKHGIPVTFGGIQNEGERLRVKLAFFLAMMRLGRKAGLGKHPGFLMVDQPGSAEMVPNDFAALASTLQQIDTELSEELQVICFTARPEFSKATVPEKVYGPQASPYVF